MQATRCGIIIVMFALALFLFQTSPVSARVQTRRSILIISPFDRIIPFSVRFFSGLTAALKPQDLNSFEIFQENLDLSQLGNNSEYIDSLPAFLSSKYASKKFDAIVAVTGLALHFLLRRCNSLSPGTPVVAVNVSKEECTGKGRGRKIIPVWTEGDEAEQTIDLILHLQPKVRKIYIVEGEGPFERRKWSRLQQEVSQYADRSRFVFLTGSRYEELLGTVKKLNPHDAVLVLVFSKDAAGRSFNPQFVTGKIAETAGCPVYGIADTWMGHGIVGGALIPIYRQGFATGRAILDLLGMGTFATRPDALKVPLLRQVDARQMVRWHLSEKNLPVGYEVVDRPHSLLRDYKGYVALALFFFLAQSALIFRLLVLGRIRRAAEGELRRTCQGLEENQQELNRSRLLQERALEDLRQSEAMLQSILASIPVGVLMIDAGTGSVRMGNRAVAELMDTPAEEMAGSPCPDCFAPFIAIGAPRPSREGGNSYEDRLVNGQGREIYVLKTVNWVSLGGRMQLIGCLLDITRRLAAEQELREKEEQLVHADKMISFGIMAAGIGHEIHNPNTSILLNAPVLKKTWEEALERLDEYAEENGDFLIGKIPYSRARIHIPALLDGIIEGSERIRNIVHSMREFVSRRSSEETEWVDINTVLRSSLNLMASKLSKATYNLQVEYGEKIPPVKANGQRLEQVAINLVLNGAEALSDKNQLLRVRTCYEPERALVVLEVRDNGQGIEPGHLKRVFDPFFTTRRETGGTGLGLAISQKIIEAYGGRIVIVSTLGEGTTATIELPAYTEED